MRSGACPAPSDSSEAFSRSGLPARNSLSAAAPRQPHRNLVAGNIMDSVLRDIRFGARTLWKDRSFALSTILTLALCIGGNVAMFTIVYSTVLQPIPVPDANRILLMAEQLPKAGLGTADVTFASEYLDRVRE